MDFLTTQTLLERQYSLYPGAEMQDMVKLLYQNEHGTGHLTEDFGTFRQQLDDERNLPSDRDTLLPDVEEVGNGLCRVHLQALPEVITTDSLAKLCRVSARKQQGSETGMLSKLGILRRLIQAKVLPYTEYALDVYLASWQADGCPMLHHSDRFIELYKPHYCLLGKAEVLMLPVVEAIDRMLGQRPSGLVAIDGMCASGKSSLAETLRQVYGANVVHADDFFLQPHQRTPQRLREAGGNIDYERLGHVMAQAAQNKETCYQSFDCKVGELTQWKCHVPGQLTVLEGAYSLHPKVGAQCDIGIFLSVDADIQLHRIRKRNGPEMAEKFKNEWIPKENEYFNVYSIRESSDLIVDTTALG